MNVSILIATYGEESWSQMAHSRALPSAQVQGAHEVLIGHDPEGTIGNARNDLAAKASGEWLCFLDADDELASGFLDAMQRAFEQEMEDGNLLLTPAVSYVANRSSHPTVPRIWPECSLTTGNWLVISTVMPRSLFIQIGGFRDYGEPPGSTGYEDWGLMARLVQEGVRIVKVPDAVLLAHISPRSRNRSADRQTRNRWHYEVGRDVWPEHYGEDWLIQNDPVARRIVAREQRLSRRR